MERNRYHHATDNVLSVALSHVSFRYDFAARTDGDVPDTMKLRPSHASASVDKASVERPVTAMAR
jgi:hypothetical protein